MDSNFTVELEVETLDPITEDLIVDLDGSDHSASVSGHPGSHRLSVIMNIGDSVYSALPEAIEWVSKQVEVTEVHAASVMTNDEFDRREAAPAFPPIGGVSEVAEVLEVSRQRISELRQRPDFPAPVTTIKAGPIWRLGDLSRFADEWERKVGRPPRRDAVDA